MRQIVSISAVTASSSLKAQMMTLGPEFRVNTYTSSYQSYPAVAIDASGNFVITWHSSGQDGSYYGVYARQISVFYNLPPVADAGFIPIDVEEDEGHFEIVSKATDPDGNLESIVTLIELPSLDGLDIKLEEEDEIKIEFDLEGGEVEIKGPDPDGLLAEIEEYGGLLVSDEQYIQVELSDDLEYELKFDDGILQVEAPEVTLRVIATDTEGASDTATASPVFAGR